MKILLVFSSSGILNWLLNFKAFFQSIFQVWIIFFKLDWQTAILPSTENCQGNPQQDLKATFCFIITACTYIHLLPFNPLVNWARDRLIHKFTRCSSSVVSSNIVNLIANSSQQDQKATYLFRHHGLPRLIHKFTRCSSSVVSLNIVNLIANSSQQDQKATYLFRHQGLPLFHLLTFWQSTCQLGKGSVHPQICLVFVNGCQVRHWYFDH